MTQGRLERGKDSVLRGVDAEASRTSPVICKQVTMRARCMSICTNEQGRRRGKARKTEKRGMMEKQSGRSRGRI